jgi:hypothetical protein
MSSLCPAFLGWAGRIAQLRRIIRRDALQRRCAATRASWTRNNGKGINSLHKWYLHSFNLDSLLTSPLQMTIGNEQDGMHTAR